MPTHFRVSGQLDFSSATHDPQRSLTISPLSSSSSASPMTVHTTKSGHFHAMLEPGHYSVAVKASTGDLEAGVVFAPPHLAILVAEAPVTNLYFSPVRVAVSGSIDCLGRDETGDIFMFVNFPGEGPCPPLTVTLKPEGFGQEVTQVAKEGKFSFANQLPGSYVVRVEESGLCWENHRVSFNIEAEPVDDLKFQQTGWVMEVHSSHETQLTFPGGELDIPVGPSSHCLDSPGPYKFSTSSCHTFHPGADKWSSNTGVLRSCH